VYNTLEDVQAVLRVLEKNIERLITGVKHSER
jgi:hypothetical protein